jgi:hypothetical protein
MKNAIIRAAQRRLASWTLGEVTPGPIFVAEGYATAATVHEISGRPCVIAYSANNLPGIVGQLREAHGQTQEIVIVADNDSSGVGRNKADQASARHGGRIVMPPIEGDANDFVSNRAVICSAFCSRHPTIGWSLPTVSQSSPPRFAGKSSIGCKAKP